MEHRLILQQKEGAEGNALYKVYAFTEKSSPYLHLKVNVGSCVGLHVYSVGPTQYTLLLNRCSGLSRLQTHLINPTL